MSIVTLFKINPLTGLVVRLKFDLEDFLHINKFRYSFVRSSTGYDEFYANIYRTWAHRGITNCPKELVVDHINRDHYDNRKSNLRICTKSQNQMNRGKQKRKRTPTSKYKGVSWSKDTWNRTVNWACEVRAKGQKRRRKRFKTEREAALQYNEWAKELHGEFAVLNEVD